MSFTNSTQFGFATINGKKAPVNVASIKEAHGKTEAALFNLRFQLGVFAIYCESKKLKIKAMAPKLAKSTGLSASTIPVYCSQGKRLVEGKATFKGLETFNRKAKKDNVKTGVENFAKSLAGQKLVPATKAAPAKVEDAPTKARTHDTHTKGKDAATRCTLSAPLVMTATAKANLREVIEGHCKASDITLESLFPELAKVTA